MTQATSQHVYDETAVTAALSELFNQAASPDGIDCDGCHILRINPDGTAHTSIEPSWCVSESEYYNRVPHALSIRIDRGLLDYSEVHADDREMFAKDAVQDFIDTHKAQIDAWIADGSESE